MKNFFDLRDKEFREFFYKYLSKKSMFHVPQTIIDFFKKEKINDSDIIKFFFDFDEILKNRNKRFYESLIMILFDYKIKKLKDDGLCDFIKIIKRECPSLNYKWNEEIKCSDFWCTLCNTGNLELKKFIKLIEIFLDEV